MFFGAFGLGWKTLSPQDERVFFLSDQAEIQHTGSTFQAEKEYLIFRGGVGWRFGPLWGGAPKDYFHGNNLFFLSDQAEI